jgi:hypothetical protein
LQKEGRFEVDHPQQTDVECGGIPPFRRLSRRKVGHLGASPADRSQPKFNFVLGDVISCTDSTNLIRVFGQTSILAKRRKPNNGPQTVLRRGRTPHQRALRPRLIRGGLASVEISPKRRAAYLLTILVTLITRMSCGALTFASLQADQTGGITSLRRTSGCHWICEKSHIGCLRCRAKIRFSTIFPKIYLINCIGLCRLGGSC